MLRCSFNVLPLGALLPHFWVSALIIAISAIVAFRHRASAIVHMPLDLVSLAIVPFTILFVGLLWWQALPGATTGWEWQFLVMYAGLLFQTFLAAVLVWRHRTRLRLSVPATLFGSLWAVGSFFVSSMALTGSWL